MISAQDVMAAATRTGGRTRRTPVLAVEPEAFGTPGPVALKLELCQHTGSFKVRGAFNRVLAATEAGNGRSPGDEPRAGVIAASGGNHGMAVAYAARELGLPAEIFVPESISPVKVNRLRTFGARVTVTGAYYADAYEASRERAAETGALVVHAYDHPAVAAGQGTVGLELLEQVPEADTVLVAVGGGGLLAGIATAVAGRAKVVAVEPEQIPTLHAALAAGGPVDVTVGGVAADALGARRLGEIGYQVAEATGVHSVLVPEQAIVAARRRLWEGARVAAEYAGVTALAALLAGVYKPEQGERVAAVVCGGNTDPSDLV